MLLAAPAPDLAMLGSDVRPRRFGFGAHTAAFPLSAIQDFPQFPEPHHNGPGRGTPAVRRVPPLRDHSGGGSLRDDQSRRG